MVRHISFLCKIVFICSTLLFLGCHEHKNKDLRAIKPKMSYSVENLISTLRTSKKYDKDGVIAVSGTVHEVNTINKRITIILKGNAVKNHFVICDMNANQTHLTKTINKGDSILVKGILKGILNDVIMLNCVIVNDQ